ncbi:hypothetical protein [Streptomyces coffeae]|uniref:Uncharacterized protein n=1 Tax=Streptomyces coffeae TaxID=621382 RepID=A0ABS1NA93_9ACTN|nr:hypothetical protein [Streptomyces coffeae]MBL1096879.1 hypothetical protein [Streptomyces coffeae]
MFEIRVICDPADTDHIVAALDRTFTTGTVTVHPARDGKRTRMYTLAEHRSTPVPTPSASPETAYHHAPPLFLEAKWCHDTANHPDHERDREYLIRKAALLDRIALHRPSDSSDAEAADAAALVLIDTDRASGLDTADAEADPRVYVREQYATAALHA